MIKKACKFCKKKFLVHLYRDKTANYCGENCYHEHQKKEAYHTKICPHCKISFFPNRATRNNKYCGRKCWILGSRKYKDSDSISRWRGIKLCPQCNREFNYASKQIHQKYCSVSCNIKSRTYERDDNFFRKINSEGKAYLLGVILSDGCIHKQAYLNISSKDIDFVLICKNLLKSAAPIHTYNGSHSLIIHSKRIHDSLCQLGVSERKSWNEYHIPRIPGKLKWHFLRGFFDGDGSFYVDDRLKWRYLCASFTCGSKKFLEDTKQWLEEHSIKTRNIRFDGEEGGKGAWQLRVTRKAAVKDFVKYLYKKSNYFLERKYKIVKNFYGK